MKLREVIKAISGHKYLVKEWDVFPNGKKSFREVNLDRSKTGIRCRSHDMWHEMQVGSKWIILTELQFRHHMEPEETIIVKEVKDDVVRPRRLYTQDIHPIDRVIFTDHFKERAEERFGVCKENPMMVRDFVKKVFDSHKLCQGVEFYNTGTEAHSPLDVYLSSLEHDCIMVIKFLNGRYLIKTTYRISVSKWFSSWFNDNVDAFHQLPTLDEFFGFKRPQL